jgi:ATP-dependent Lhr-like helicase
LDGSCLIPLAKKETVLFTWRGTIATETLALALKREGLGASARPTVIEFKEEQNSVKQVLRSLSEKPAPQSTDLTQQVENLVSQKFHPYLSRELLAADLASERIVSELVPELAETEQGPPNFG